MRVYGGRSRASFLRRVGLGVESTSATVSSSNRGWSSALQAAGCRMPPCEHVHQRLLPSRRAGPPYGWILCNPSTTLHLGPAPTDARAEVRGGDDPKAHGVEDPGQPHLLRMPKITACPRLHFSDACVVRVEEYVHILLLTAMSFEKKRKTPAHCHV